MIKQLIKNISREFVKNNKSNSFSILIQDSEYLDFMSHYDGGYFYNHSLHIYGKSNELNYHSIEYINQILNVSFLNIFEGLIAFSEDVFGNPFCFSNEGIVYFNIETGSRELLAKDFNEWLSLLYSDLAYFTGKDLVVDNDVELSYGKRLCPKLPFILGGEYLANNLILKDFEENIEFSSSIAKQVYDLPDGTEFKINIK